MYIHIYIVYMYLRLAMHTGFYNVICMHIIYIYIYTYTHIYIYTYIHIYKYIYINKNKYVYVYTHVVYDSRWHRA